MGINFYYLIHKSISSDLEGDKEDKKGRKMNY